MFKQKMRNAPISNTNKLEIDHETGEQFVSGTVKQVSDAFTSLGTGIFEQLLSTITNVEKKNPQEEGFKNHKMDKTPSLDRGEVFSLRYIEERKQIDEIRQLIEAIKKEVEAIKSAGRSLVSEISDIEKITLSSMPEQPGVYHIRFLELILKILFTLKKKINESSSWMDALRSKKAKRGSAFMNNAKKKGTQYSMSQELILTRSVQ